MTLCGNGNEYMICASLHWPRVESWIVARMTLSRKMTSSWNGCKWSF